MFDKATEWHFRVIRYPSAYSNVPMHQPAGVFIGQCARFWHICNNTLDFKIAVVALARRLLLRGHTPTTLKRAWAAFCRAVRSPPLHKRISTWFPRALDWARCHPLPNATIPPLQEPPPSFLVFSALPHDSPRRTTARRRFLRRRYRVLPPTPVPHLSPPLPGPPTLTSAPPLPGPSLLSPTALPPPAFPGPPTRRPNRRRNPPANHNMCALHAANACLSAYHQPPFTEPAFFQLSHLVQAQVDILIPNQTDGPRVRTPAGFDINVILAALHERGLHTQHLANLQHITAAPPAVRAFLLHGQSASTRSERHFLALTLSDAQWHLWDDTHSTRSFPSLQLALTFFIAQPHARFQAMQIMTAT